MIPTQRQIDLMDPRDRQQFPRKIRLTTSERAAEEEHKGELKMHDDFCATLKRHNKTFAYIHANPRKRSTIRKGWPDFSVICKLGQQKNSVCLIEFKVPSGRLSPDQIELYSEFSAAGIDVFVVTSLADAIAQLLEYFELPKEVLNHE